MDSIKNCRTHLTGQGQHLLSLHSASSQNTKKNPDMYLTTALLTAITAISSAAATPDYCAGDPSAFGYCTTGTFVSTTTSSSPLVSACQSRCFGISSDAGDWIANFSGTALNHVDNMVGGPCGISLSRGNNDPNEAFFPN